MPALDFVLPHWAYWCGLVFFPLFAMVMVRRSPASSSLGRPTLSVGYLTLLTAGFVGLHRFYVRSWLGLLYLIPFVGILYANGAGREAREALSRARNESMVAEFRLEQLEGAAEQGRDVAADKLEAARDAVTAVYEQVAAAGTELQSWSAWASGFAIGIAVMLAIDALLLPVLVRRQAQREASAAAANGGSGSGNGAQAARPDAAAPVAGKGPVGAIHWLSRFSGEFVAYWSVIAVFVYYYEVIARYVFNSPTNWAHESMFLMFGMQYLISGAYAYLADAHVRVDIFYARLSPRGKAASDLATSVFFFIFAGTMLATGWIFMMDSVRVWEVSFTEWAIQYWPVKITITLGALLIVLQGVAKLITDVQVLAAGGRR